MIAKKIIELLKDREFVSVATCGLNNRPNAAPKFLLKIENNFVYLIDYTIGRTWENIQINPQVSISFADTDSLKGYQVNGSVEIINEGPDYKKIVKELHDKEVSLSSKRIVEGIYRGKKHENFEVIIPEKFIIFKVKIDDVVEICLCGDLKREKICES